MCFHRQAALFLEDGSGGAGGMTCFPGDSHTCRSSQLQHVAMQAVALFLKDGSGGAVGMNRFPGGKSLVFLVKVTLSGGTKFGLDSRMQIGSSRLQCPTL